VKVHVGDDPVVKNNPVCQGAATPDASWNNYETQCDLVGRYVGAALEETNYLTLCEVDVWNLPALKLVSLSTVGLTATQSSDYSAAMKAPKAID
jgi:hypothetical protein